MDRITRQKPRVWVLLGAGRTAKVMKAASRKTYHCVCCMLARRQPLSPGIVLGSQLYCMYTCRDFHVFVRAGTISHVLRRRIAAFREIFSVAVWLLLLLFKSHLRTRLALSYSLPDVTVNQPIHNKGIDSVVDG